MASALLRSIIMGGRTDPVRTLRTWVGYERRIGVGSREGRYRPLLLEALAPVSRGQDLAAGDLLGPLRPLRQRRRFQAGPVLIRGPGRMGGPMTRSRPTPTGTSRPPPTSVNDVLESSSDLAAQLARRARESNRQQVGPAESEHPAVDAPTALEQEGES